MRGPSAALLPAIWPFSAGISVLFEEKYSWCISVRPQNRETAGAPWKMASLNFYGFILLERGLHLNRYHVDHKTERHLFVLFNVIVIIFFTLITK